MVSRRVNNTEAEAVTGRTVEEVERELAHTIDELQTLRAERDALPAQAAEARVALDTWRLEALERRERELSVRIDEAQARFCRLQAERARLLLPAAEAQAEAAQAVYERAHAEYLRAHELTNQLGVECNNAQQQVQNLRQSVEANEQRARELSFGLAARQS